MAEAVRFELTNPYGLPVFKTGAISQTLPHFQIASLHSLGLSLVLALRQVMVLVWTRPAKLQ